MAFGIECGDGWFDLLHKMCLDIQALNPHDDFKFLQIKEKFGTLRVYVISATQDDVYSIIDAAEEASANICEDCGVKDGVTVEGPGWIRALCPECRGKR